MQVTQWVASNGCMVPLHMSLTHPLVMRIEVASTSLLQRICLTPRQGERPLYQRVHSLNATKHSWVLSGEAAPATLHPQGKGLQFLRS